MKNILIILSVCWIIFASAEPMTGNYTVGGVEPDFNTIQEIVTALETNGISTDVNIFIRPGTYNEHVTIGNISGANSNNWVTIKSDPSFTGDVIWQAYSDDYSSNFILNLVDASYLKILDITFQPLNENYGRMIVLDETSNNIVISSNAFQGLNNQSNNRECIYGNSGDLASITISGNLFNSGGYGVHLSTSSYVNLIEEVAIFENTFIDQYTAIYAARTYDLYICDNIIEHSQFAMPISEISGNIEIERNQLKEIKQYGLSLSSCDANVTNGNNGIVANNIIHISGENYSGTAYNAESKGMMISYCEDLKVCYNNVLLTGTSTYYETYSAGISGGERNTIVNNAFINTGGGMAINSSGIDEDNIDYNNIYTTGYKLGRDSNDYFYKLEDYAADTNTNLNSISIHPLYADAELQQTESPWIDNSGASISDVTVDFNNLPRDTSTPDIGAFEFTSNSADTPLSGTYQVGVGYDYDTISEIVDDLNFRGVNSNVVVQLMDETYNEQFIFHKIPNSSSSNYIYFINNSSALQCEISYNSSSVEDNYIAKLLGTCNITFDDIKFEATGTYCKIFDLHGYFSNLAFLNSSFYGNNSSSSYNDELIYAYTDSYFNDLQISNNQFFEGSKAVYFHGDSNQYSENVIIENNEFFNSHRSIDVALMESPIIEDNLFEDFSYCGISMNQCANTFKIEKNRLNSENNAQGIIVGSSSGGDTQPERGLIANNTVHITASSSGTGLSITADNTDLVYNSIFIESDSNGKGLYQYNAGSNNLIQNNIFSVTNGNAIENINPNDLNTYSHNDLYTTGSNFAQWDEDVYSLEELQTVSNSHENSWSVDPYFTNDMHTTSPVLDGNGLSLSFITTDLDGDLRESNPDPGADEYTVPAGNQPLVGTFTIGSDAKSDYNTIAEAIADAEFRGIAASIRLQILPGIYDEQIKIHQIPYTDISNPVTIESSTQNAEDVIWKSTSESDADYVVKLVSTDHINFENITFETNKNYATIFSVNGQCDDVDFLSCHFQIDENISTADHIMISPGYLKNSTISQCEFNFGDDGICFYGENYVYDYHSNIDIEDCTFTNVSEALYLDDVKNIEISGNHITNCVKALTASYCEEDFIFTNNRIFSSGFSSAYNSYTFVTIGNCEFTAVDDALIANNIIYSDDNWVPSMNGISISTSDFINIVHNTILMENTRETSNYGAALSLSNTENCTILNNILAAKATQYAIELVNNSNLNCDYNDLYSEGIYLSKLEDEKYMELADFRANSDFADHSIVANPLLDGNIDATCSYLIGKGTEISAVTYDIDNHPRPVNPCIGANEFSSSKNIPLAGNYQINVDDGGDYNYLFEAVNDLMDKGSSANVTFSIVAGDYLEQCEIFEIPNNGTKYGLTIKSENDNAEDVTYRYPATSDKNYLIKMNGTDNVTIEHITFQNIETDYNRMVSLYGISDDITITNCIFYGTELMQNNDVNNASIYSHNSIYNSRNFSDNVINYGGYAYYSTRIDAFSGLSENLNIFDNLFSQNYAGIWLENENNFSITDNTVSAAEYTGINIRYCTGPFIINRNSLSNLSQKTLSIYRCAGTFNDWIKIYNNWLYAPQSATNSALLYVSDSDYLKIFHNSLNNLNQSTTSSALETYSGCTEIQLINNILCNKGGGYSIKTSSTNAFSGMEYNHFYTTGNYFANWAGTHYELLTDFMGATGMNSNSNWSEPFFVMDSAPALEQSSGAVDHGVEISEISTDLFGTLRDAQPDIGCYEYVGVLGVPQDIAISIENNQVILSWNGVSGADFYQIESAESPEGSFSLITTTSNTQIELSIPEINTFYRVIAKKNDSKKR